MRVLSLLVLFISFSVVHFAEGTVVIKAKIKLKSLKKGIVWEKSNPFMPALPSIRYKKVKIKILKVLSQENPETSAEITAIANRIVSKINKSQTIKLSSNYAGEELVGREGNIFDATIYVFKDIGATKVKTAIDINTYEQSMAMTTLAALHNTNPSAPSKKTYKVTGPLGTLEIYFDSNNQVNLRAQMGPTKIDTAGTDELDKMETG